MLTWLLTCGAQILMEAKQKLGGTVRQKLADAIASRRHEDVVRFTRLYRPLRMQVGKILCKDGPGSATKDGLALQHSIIVPTFASAGLCWPLRCAARWRCLQARDYCTQRCVNSKCIDAVNLARNAGGGAARIPAVPVPASGGAGAGGLQHPRRGRCAARCSCCKLRTKLAASALCNLARPIHAEQRLRSLVAVNLRNADLNC